MLESMGSLNYFLSLAFELSKSMNHKEYRSDAEHSGLLAYYFFFVEDFSGRKGATLFHGLY
jgi:hypothetical protein